MNQVGIVLDKNDSVQRDFYNSIVRGGARVKHRVTLGLISRNTFQLSSSRDYRMLCVDDTSAWLALAKTEQVRVLPIHDHAYSVVSTLTSPNGTFLTLTHGDRNYLDAQILEQAVLARSPKHREKEFSQFSSDGLKALAQRTWYGGQVIRNLTLTTGIELPSLGYTVHRV